MANKILKCFYNDGNECTIDECDYLQLELLGRHGQGNYALVSKASIDVVLSFKWYLGKDGYPVSYGSGNDFEINTGRGIKMHRLLKEAPKDFVVDHRNRIKLDNRLENLRICSSLQNSYNTSRKGNRYKGVRKIGKGYMAEITKAGNKYAIKDISSADEAARIYDMMAEELFGEYAGKNFSL